MGLFAKIKQMVMASKAGKIAAGAAIVLILGGGIAGVTYAAVSSNAEAVVMRSVISTFTGQNFACEEMFGLQALSENLKEQGREFALEVGIPELPLGDFGLGDMTLPEAGLSLNVRVNPGKEGTAELSAKAANTTLLSGNLYFSPEQLQVNVPKLFQPVLAINYGAADFTERAKASYAAQYLGITDAQIDEVSEYLPKQTTPVDREELITGLVEIILSNYDYYLGETELKKAGKEELSAGDASLKCKVYSAEMDGREVGQFLDLTHFTVKEYVKEHAENYNITPEQVEEAFGPAGTFAYQIKSWLRGPVTVTYYVWEERLVKIAMNWTMEQFAEAGSTMVPGNMVITFAPDGNPLENMYLDLHTPVHQDVTVTNVPQRVDLTYQAVTEYTEEDYAVSYSVNYNATPYYLALDYEALSGEFECKAEAGEVSLMVTGVMDTLEKGSAIGIEADWYKYKDGEYSEENDLDVRLSVKVLETEVVSLSDKTQDVLAMAEHDFTALEEEITKNITWMLFSMMGLFQ